MITFDTHITHIPEGGGMIPCCTSNISPKKSRHFELVFDEERGEKMILCCTPNIEHPLKKVCTLKTSGYFYLIMKQVVQLGTPGSIRICSSDND